MRSLPILLFASFIILFGCSGTEQGDVAILETDEGTIVLTFYPDVAPNHVENFKSLAREGFYDGTKFHRVIPGFMIQGGCPNTKDRPISKWGQGNPGYTVEAEFNDKPHVRGSLSMARGNDINSAGSQFFICHDRAPHLDGKYTNFGEVLEGMDVVDKIATAPVVPETKGKTDRPVDPVTLQRVTIVSMSEYQNQKKG